PARTLAAWAWFAAHRETAGAFRYDGFRSGQEPAPVRVALDEPVVLDGPEPEVRFVRVRHDEVELVHQGQRFVFERPDPFADHGPAAGDGSLLAPMPGT